MRKPKRSQPNNRLKEERIRRGWSQSLVAEKIGSDPKTVGRWERGETTPGLHLRKQLCDLFEAEPEVLGLVSKENKEVQGQHDSEKALEATSSINQEILEYTHETNGSTPTLEVHTSPPDIEQQESSSVEESTGASSQKETVTIVPSPIIDKNRQRMIERVSALWISGLLEQSLHGAVLLAMGLHENPAAVAEPWRLALQEMERPPQDLPPGTHITQVYEATNGELLLLGEPGSGKTTLLLELTRDLLQRARENSTHPIPVVFNLSSWAIKRQSLADWLIEELKEKYQVPHSLGKEWVQTDSVLPLLDGLDEVDLVHRATCVNAINSYRKSHGLLPMVVCSRSTDYFALRSHLLLRSAVVLQPLTMQQVDEYLSSLGEEVEGVRLALQEDKELQELATTPLLLSILTLAYRGQASTDLLAHPSSTNRRQAVFDYYVKQMLQRRSTPRHFSSQETEYWLVWVAKQLVKRKQTEFYIEQMQFDWLPENWIHRFLPVLSLGLAYGLFICLIVVVFNALFFELRISLFIGTALGLFNASLYCVFNSLALDLFYNSHASSTKTNGLHSLNEMISILIPVAKNRLTYGLLFGVFNGLFYGLVLGMINELHTALPDRISYSLRYGLLIGIGLGILGKFDLEIRPAETLIWSLQSFQKNAVKFLLIGGGVGFLYSLVYPLPVKIAFVLFAGTSAVFLGGVSNKALERHERLKPNQGIRRSLRNSVFTGVGGGLLAWLVTGGAFSLFYGPFVGLIYGCIPLLAVGGTVALLQGGTASLLHLVLRFLLWQNGYIPWSYPRFLDYAAERILLRKIGGGYIFIHRLVLEYFASQHLHQLVQMRAALQRSSRRKILIGSVTFATGSVLGALKLSDLLPSLPGTLLYVYVNHTNQVSSIAISPDSRLIVSGGHDETVHAWNATNGEELLTHDGYSGWVNVVTWSHSPDGKFIASGSDDGTIQVWDVTRRRLVFTYGGHLGEGQVNSLTWSPDGKYVASGSDNGGILRIWNANSGKDHLVLGNAGSFLHALGWSPCSTFLAFEGGAGNVIQILNVAEKHSVQTFRGHKNMISCLTWSHNGKYLASSSFDLTCRVWNIKDKESDQTNEEGNIAYILSWSPDSLSAMVRISNRGSQSAYQTYQGLDLVYGLSWSPDSQCLAFGGTKGVHIWNIEKRSHILNYAEHGGRVYSVAWAPNGQYIASSSSDTTVHVWKAPQTLHNKSDHYKCEYENSRFI